MSHDSAAGPFATCTGPAWRPHRWIMFERADGPCPECAMMDFAGKVKAQLAKEHAEASQTRPLPYRPMLTEEEIAEQPEKLSLAAWVKAVWRSLFPQHPRTLS